MKLTHAIRVCEKLLEEAKPPMRLTIERVSAGRDLRPEEVIALIVLVQFAKRVLGAKESVRALSRALMGDDELNQEELALAGSGEGSARE